MRINAFARREARDFPGVALTPTKDFVEFANMLNFGSGEVSLQRTNENAEIETSLRQVGNGPEQWHVEFV